MFRDKYGIEWTVEFARKYNWFSKSLVCKKNDKTKQRIYKMTFRSCIPTVYYEVERKGRTKKESMRSSMADRV